MRKQRTFIFLLFISMLGGLFAKEQSVNNFTLNLTNGTQKVVTLSSLGKIDFANNSMFLHYLSLPNEDFTLASIKSIVFKDFSSAIENQKLSNKIVLYPSLADKFICLSNLPNYSTILTLFRQDGMTLFRSTVSNSEYQMDVSRFGKGIYFISVNNQVLKFVKK